jgi:hypothetical protein
MLSLVFFCSLSWQHGEPHPPVEANVLKRVRQCGILTNAMRQFVGMAGNEAHIDTVYTLATCHCALVSGCELL